MTIANIRPGNEVVGTFVVAESKTAEARTGKQYLRILLRDTQGQSILGFFFAAPDAILRTDFSGKTVEYFGNKYRQKARLLPTIFSQRRDWDSWIPRDTDSPKGVPS